MNIEATQEAGPEVSSEPGSFEQLFNEAATERDDPAETASDATGAADVGTDPNPPAADAVRDEAVAGDAPPAETSDIWQNAPADLVAAHKAALDEMRHREASVRGRLSALDRQNAELRRLVSGTTMTSAQRQEEPPLSQRLEGEQFAKLREEYGEIVDPIMDVLQAQAQEIERMRGSVQQSEQERSAAFYAQQLDALNARAPGWLEDVNSPDFMPWVEQQPRHVRDAFERNAQAIADVDEAFDVVARFRAARQEQAPQTPSADPRRQRQIDGARTVTTRAPAPSASGGDSDSFDALFAAEAAKRERAKRR